MKLLHKNILINTSVSLVIILIGGFISYNFILSKVKEESREHLWNEKTSIEQKLNRGTSISILENNIGDIIQIKQIPALSGKQAFYKTISLKEESNSTEESFTAIMFECSAKDQNYRVTIIKMVDNDEELGENILFAVVISALLMVIAMVLANIFIYKKLWSPFYRIVKTLQNFNISKRDTIQLPKTKTDEFNKLNNSIALMAKKISEDYFSLKEFTENASHEIQTPLAVIHSKIEICLQDEHLSPEQASLLVEANQAVNTLVNLNKGLITLAKLDNNQIDVPSQINVYDEILNRLNAYEDFIQEQDIDVNLKIDKNIFITINRSFSVILFDNLIKNAIKHNLPSGGKINIEVTHQFIKISNTGFEPKVDPNKFFERFYKGSNKGSLGLGLAIVKKIGEIYNLNITYQYADELHIICLQLEQ